MLEGVDFVKGVDVAEDEVDRPEEMYGEVDPGCKIGDGHG